MTDELIPFPRAEETETVEVSVLLPADMIAALKVAGFQRRSLGEDDAGVSQLVRKAVEEWLDREIRDETAISIQI